MTSDSDTATYAYHPYSALVNTHTFKENGTTTRLTTTRAYDRLNRLSSISSTPTGAPCR